MGLDITTRTAHARWSYRGFHHFRVALARHQGIDLGSMEGFTGGGPGESWNGILSPLRPLLHHSDCDGFLTPDDCRSMAGTLLDAINAIWKPSDYDWRQGVNLVQCMIDAIETGQDLEFR